MTKPSMDEALGSIFRTTSKCIHLKIVYGFGGMAQWIRILLALAENPGFSSKHPHSFLKSSLPPVPGGPMPSSGSVDTRHT